MTWLMRHRRAVTVSGVLVLVCALGVVVPQCLQRGAAQVRVSAATPEGEPTVAAQPRGELSLPLLPALSLFGFLVGLGTFVVNAAKDRAANAARIASIDQKLDDHCATGHVTLEDMRGLLTEHREDDARMWADRAGSLTDTIMKRVATGLREQSKLIRSLSAGRT